MDVAESAELAAGIRLFNDGQHWHAHEAWEHLWLQLDGEDKRFVQGLIMAAAMLVQYGKGVRRGVINHHRNATQRLSRHGPMKWGIDVVGLVRQLDPFLADAETEGPLARPTGTVQIRR